MRSPGTQINWSRGNWLLVCSILDLSSSERRGSNNWPLINWSSADFLLRMVKKKKFQ